jgi:hypothetical protein
MPFFYKTSSGADLLNTQTPGSYKQTDLLVTSKVIPEGGSSSQVINLAVPEITIINDAASGYNYFVAELPTEVHRHPLILFEVGNIPDQSFVVVDL